jgi:uncharacterized protein (DUF2267 family)
MGKSLTILKMIDSPALDKLFDRPFWLLIYKTIKSLTIKHPVMSLDKYYQEAQMFIRNVKEELGESCDLHQSERIMASVFHTLRDILTPQESLHLIAQLPVLIKGIYVHGWHLGTKKSIRSMDEFIECLMLQSPRTAATDFGNDEKAKERTKAVFRVLRSQVAIGEIKDILDQLPSELTELFLTENEEKERYSI